MLERVCAFVRVQGVGYSRSPPVYLKKGDVVSITITGLGTLVNPVGEETDFGGVRLE